MRLMAGGNLGTLVSRDAGRLDLGRAIGILAGRCGGPRLISPTDVCWDSRLLLHERPQKFSGARWSCKGEPNGTTIWLDGDSESKEPATLALGVDHQRNRVENLRGGRKTKAAAIGRFFVRAGPSH